MIKILTIQKITLLCFFMTLVGCNNSNSKMWERYHKINSEKSKRLSKSHDKYFELNDNTDSNFIITSHGIKPKKQMTSIF